MERIESLYCAACPREWDVSEEDPDSTLSDAIDHVGMRHPHFDPILAIKTGKRP